GTYTYEFHVFSANSLVLTSDYSGEVKFTASAYAPAGSSQDIIAGIGTTSVAIGPVPVYYTASPSPVLQTGKAARLFDITVYNANTNTPLSGYSYDVQALSGAVTMGATSPSQTVTQTTSYNAIYGFGYASVLVGATPDYNLTAITGVTPTNGTIVVSLAANASVNFTAMGSSFESWLFLGDYAVGGALAGAAPYAVIAELTTALNPSGFGLPQPVEIPVTVTDVSPSIVLSIATSSTTTTDSGTVTVSVTARNATTGAAVPDYTVELLSQNALGANRGLLYGAGTTPFQGYNPNMYFGSGYLYGVELTTNSAGNATVSFSPLNYTPEYVGGIFIGFSTSPFSDPYLVPFDEFQLTAVSVSGGAGAASAGAVVTSSAYTNNVAPSYTVQAYLGGASTSAGVSTIVSGTSVPIFLNSTLSGMAGPSVGGVSVSVTVTSGSVSPAQGTTSSNGTFQATYTSPAVLIVTPVNVLVTFTPTSGPNVTVSQTFFLLPAPAPVPPPPAPTNNVPASAYVAYGLAAVFAVIAVALGVMYIGARKRRGPPPGNQSPPAWQAPTQGGSGDKPTTGK
ncbi:extracellular solute-binding protein, partial [mine drainage metagenome]